MTKSRIKFGALLAVMLIMSMALVPAVSAQAENEKIEKIEKEIQKQVGKLLKDNAPDDLKIDWIIDENNRKEYKATASKDGAEQEFLVKQWQETIDGKEVWRFNVFETQPDGVVASSISFGKDSYYSSDSSGIHMHFGPLDKTFIKEFTSAAIVLIGGVIAILAPPTAPYVAVFASALIIVIIVVEYVESNSDGSIDVFISWTSLALIPVYAILWGSQKIYVKIGSNNYPVYI